MYSVRHPSQWGSRRATVDTSGLRVSAGPLLLAALVGRGVLTWGKGQEPRTRSPRGETGPAKQPMGHHQSNSLRCHAHGSPLRSAQKRGMRDPCWTSESNWLAGWVAGCHAAQRSPGCLTARWRDPGPAGHRQPDRAGCSELARQQFHYETC